MSNARVASSLAISGMFMAEMRNSICQSRHHSIAAAYFKLHQAAEGKAANNLISHKDGDTGQALL